MKRLMFFVLVLVFVSANAFAGFFSSGSENKVSHGREQSTVGKETLQQQKSHGRRRSKIKSTQQSEETQKAISHAKQIVQGIHISVSVPISTVAFPAIVHLETHGKYRLFRKCRVYTKQRTLANFLQYEQDGVVDLIAKQYYEATAAQGGTVRCSSCVRYARCLVDYGAVVAQATLNLINDLSDLQAQGIVKIKKEGIKGMQTLKIQGISLQTLQGMFYAEIVHVLKTKQGYFFRILRGVDFNSDTVKLQNGSQGFIALASGHSVYVVLPRECTVDGMPWVSQEAFGGIAFRIEISRGWSYQTALNALKSSIKLRTKAITVEKYAQLAKEKGMSKEYLLTLKKGTDLLMSGNTNFDAQSLVPLQ